MGSSSHPRCPSFLAPSLDPVKHRRTHIILNVISTLPTRPPHTKATRRAHWGSSAESPSTFATNGHQLIGIGTYRKSPAGAVTANPGSAMTAVANPAGSARIGRRADLSMEPLMPSRSVDFTALGGRSASGFGFGVSFGLLDDLSPAVIVGAGNRSNHHWDVALAAMYAKKYTFTAPATDPQTPNAKIRLGETSVSANIGYRF